MIMNKWLNLGIQNSITMEYRIEKDSLGEVQVPANQYWAAQTQRSLQNFKIGGAADKMPLEIIRAFAILKKAAAYTNQDLGVLAADKAALIAEVCDEIIAGKLDEEFPLVIWQTGSGTQSNMNVNEVIANRAQVLAGFKIGEGEQFIKANDDVNKSQSSNDTFPTGMHIAAYKQVVEITIPGMEKLRDSLDRKAKEFANIIEYVTSDSVTYLESLSDEDVQNIDLFYFDSYDLAIPDPVPSQLHHYRELAAVYKRLKLDVYLAVDDNFLPGNWVEWWTMDKEGNITNKSVIEIGIYRILGKGTLIDHFLLTNGWQRKEDWFYLGGSQLLSYERI